MTSAPQPPHPQAAGSSGLKVASAAFDREGPMRAQHTRAGGNRSPVLTWRGAPAGTRSFVLLCEDTDTEGEEPVAHWLLFNIGADAAGLPEGVEAVAHPGGAGNGACHGTNDFGSLGYHGPRRVNGRATHFYHFRLYALDIRLDLPAGVPRAELVRSLRPHVLAFGEVVGASRSGLP